MPQCARRQYKQHRPEETALFPLVRDNLEGFLAQCRRTYRSGIPRYVEKELREYLECGIHAHGFARAVCSSCGHELLLAFSCKRRGVCPSCNARRMSDTAARLIDTVLPPVRLRQWVLSVPYELRVILAKNPAALSACGRLFIEEIFRWQRLIGAWRGLVPANDAAKFLRGGAVSFPQRFGGSLNLNVHYHVVVPEAVFYRDAVGDLNPISSWRASVRSFRRRVILSSAFTVSSLPIAPGAKKSSHWLSQSRRTRRMSHKDLHQHR